MNQDLDTQSLVVKIKQAIFGAPRNIEDPKIFHKLALIPVLAWVGLGADGLSSSSYGPEEAFRALGQHSYLALFLALGTALTVFVISYAYSRIIEHFPHGGGGYIVATHMLGEKIGVISGSALIVDYILTITVSIAACSDAIFSYLPLEYQQFRVPFAGILILLLIVLNIRGIRESITGLAPIFVTFIVTHLLLLGYGIFSHVGNIVPIASNAHLELSKDIGSIGLFGIMLLLLRAYSLGGGTYTGIEAVSNGLQIMRDPKVKTGKRTMLYMSSSLAFTAGGLFLCYLLFHVKIEEGRTLNAVLADSLFSAWSFGKTLAVVTIFSEGALLLVGAQAGFIDAPRVMANMAVDSWFPHRFAAFSERLTMRNGVMMVGFSALILLFYTRGSISALVVMYSINVFLTFSLSTFGMCKFFIQHRKVEKHWIKDLLIQSTGLILCITILIITVFEKFLEGGWLTLLITGALIFVCHTIRKHYAKINDEKKKFDVLLSDIPAIGEPSTAPIDKTKMTAVQLVSNFNGFGVHTFFTIIRQFPDFYKNFIFVSVVVIDQGLFKGEENLETHKIMVEESLKKYVALARKFGFPAEYRLETGTDMVKTGTELCLRVTQEYPRSTVFTGKLAFKIEKLYHKVLHNEAAFAIQRNLHWSGVTNIILPIRMEG
jgi:amino acid transporter